MSESGTTTLRERLVKIEVAAENSERRLMDHITEEEREFIIQRALIQEIRDNQVKMKGFWGGVVFVFSALGVALGVAASYFIK